MSAPTESRGTSLFVEAAGRRLHFLEHGDPSSPPLVILPGITSPAITWEFVALELADEHRVLTMDLRGRGLSDIGSNFSSQALAEDLATALPALGAERPAILGHSAGARVAAQFGVLYPALRGPVIVADPPLSGPGRPPYPTPLEPFLASIALARAGTTAAEMRPFFPTWTDEQLELRAAWLGTCDPSAVAEVYRSFHDEDFFETWRRLAPPALFVYGGESPVVPADVVPEVVAANPAAEYAVVPGAAHMLPWDDLAGFVAVVCGFLGGSR